jgi:pyrroline-5-carboxylate reductase
MPIKLGVSFANIPVIFADVHQSSKIFFMSAKNISIIGGGNLGSSIAEGLLKSGKYQAKNLTVTRRRIEKLQHLADSGVKIHSDNRLAVSEADIVIVAVKPNNLDKILQEIKPKLQVHHVLVSVVTGVSMNHMQTIVGEGISIFRAMPNTAIAIGESMTCISAQNGSMEQMEEVEHIFAQVGKTVNISEELMDASTVLAACGIAYALRFIRAASQGGIEIGFDAATAQTIAAQTVKGAAGLLIEGKQHPEYEIDKVTTPMGCTIAGLNEMEHQGFSSSLIKGIITSYNKI